MTDNDIIKALKCCVNDDCLNCPRWSEEWSCGVCADFLPSVLSLVNRQKAEIESLRDIIRVTDQTIKKACALAKSEAIKEFAERLEEDLGDIFMVNHPCVSTIIDNIKKEMTEEKRKERE